MTERDDDFELVHGSGNVFADFGAPDASLRQLRAILAAEIIKTLDAERLTVRGATLEEAFLAMTATDAERTAA